MLWARSVMDDWIGEDGGDPHIKTLTAYFLGLYFIMATQVVDGYNSSFSPQIQPLRQFLKDPPFAYNRARLCLLLTFQKRLSSFSL